MFGIVAQPVLVVQLPLLAPSLEMYDVTHSYV